MPLYSEEVQDLMGHIPGRILRIGLTIIFSIILMLLMGSYFFKYPEIVSVPVRLTTIHPPQELYSMSTGVLERLEVREHDTVTNGQLIAVIANTAMYDDVLKLEKLFLQGIHSGLWDSIVMTQEVLPDLSLGEMQAHYLRWCNAWINFKRYLQQNYLPQKIILQSIQVDKQLTDYHEMCCQQELKYHNFDLSQKQFQRDSLFYHHHPDAISLVNYEKQVQEYLQKKSAYMDFRTSVRQAEYEVLKQKNQLIDIQITYEQELHSFRQTLNETYQLLIESYNQWNEKYVLVSSIDGIVTLTRYWSSQQMVNSGERVATIVPLEELQIIVRGVIDMNGIGKVEKGQKVNIKLSGFPYMEFGMLRGIVNHVSLVPEQEGGYATEIILESGMQSSYIEELRFIHDLKGVAEIITKKERLISRLINPLKSKIRD